MNHPEWFVGESELDRGEDPVFDGTIWQKPDLTALRDGEDPEPYFIAGDVCDEQAAKRIVAAVNAAIGLSDEQVATLADSVGQLIAQRERLLMACQAGLGFIEALKVPQTISDAAWQVMRGSRVIDSMRAAIEAAND